MSQNVRISPRIILDECCLLLGWSFVFIRDIDRSAKTVFSTETKQGMQLTVTWLGLTHKACIKYNVFTLRGKSTPEPDLPQTTQAR